MPRLRFSDAESAATEISESGSVGWRDLREVWLRDGQMGSLDYAHTITAESTWERFGKEVRVAKVRLNRAESAGHV